MIILTGTKSKIRFICVLHIDSIAKEKKSGKGAIKGFGDGMGQKKSKKKQGRKNMRNTKKAEGQKEQTNDRQ